MVPKKISKPTDKKKNLKPIPGILYCPTPNKKKPYYVDMSDEITNRRIYTYVFRVDEEHGKVSGVARIRDFSEDINKYKDIGLKWKAQVYKGKDDIWDPLIGVALCKLKLDNLVGRIAVNIIRTKPLPHCNCDACKATKDGGKIVKMEKDLGWHKIKGVCKGDEVLANHFW